MVGLVSGLKLPTASGASLRTRMLCQVVQADVSLVAPIGKGAPSMSGEEVVHERHLGRTAMVLGRTVDGFRGSPSLTSSPERMSKSCSSLLSLTGCEGSRPQ